MARREAANCGRFLVRFRLRHRAVGERDLRRREAQAVAIERSASSLARTVKDGLPVRPDKPKVDVRIERDRPVGGDQNSAFGLTPSESPARRRRTPGRS